MTPDHPITPPRELVEKWAHASPIQHSDENWAYELYIVHRAVCWGANQELEACCEWVGQWCPRWPDGTRPEEQLRSARRPKPPSLKELALEAMTRFDGEMWCAEMEYDLAVIRTALEALPND